MTDPIVDFINVRTMQAVRVSVSPRVDAIRERFHAEVTARSINNMRCRLKLNYQPAQNVQLLTNRRC
jgi:hypothetical protein